MKSVMSSQPIPLFERFRSNLKIFRAYRSGHFGGADDLVEHHQHLVETFTTQTGIPVNQARVLEIGCGQLARQTALFSSVGADATGIDVEVPTYHMTPSVFLKVLRQNGLERALKSAIRAILFDNKRKLAIAEKTGHPVPFKNLDVRVMDACATDFADDTFDYILSRAVFEHIEDVPAAVAEVNRIMKPGGFAVIYIHLFPSLSGGHNIEWGNPDVQRERLAEPWDHLLENKFPVNTYLNKLRIDDYRKIFYEALDVQKEITISEGEQYLNDEQYGKLRSLGYTHEDLTTRTIGFYAKCKSKGTAEVTTE